MTEPNELKDMNLTIAALEIKNVKGVRAVNLEFDPDKNLFVVGGENEAGKTSTIDALWYAIGGARNIPEKPIRDGEREAFVEVKVRNRDTGKVELIARRKWWYSRKRQELKTSLELTDPIGTEFNAAQSILDRLYSHLIDPVEFMGYDRKKKVEAVRECVGLDFAELDGKRKRIETERTGHNANVRTLEAQFRDMPEHPDAVGKTVPDLTDIIAEGKKADEATVRKGDLLREAGDAIASATRIRAITETTIKEVADMRAKIEQMLKGNVERSHAEAELIETAKTLKAEAEAIVIPEAVDVASKVAEAEDLKSKIKANEDRAAKLKELEEAEKLANAADDAIKAIDSKKEAALAEAKFPVEGMSFAGDHVTYNGVDLDDCCTSEQIRVSAGMALANLPALAVLLIRRSESLDPKNLQAIEAMAKERGALIIAERVSTGPECSVVIEDGVGNAITPPPTPKSLQEQADEKQAKIDGGTFDL